MDRVKRLFSGHTMADIWMRLRAGERWSGTRQGVKILIRMNPPSFGDQRIVWSARVNKNLYEGAADNVTDAARQIERLTASLKGAA
jgi:hypothetical protein